MGEPKRKSRGSWPVNKGVVVRWEGRECQSANRGPYIGSQKDEQTGSANTESRLGQTTRRVDWVSQHGAGE